MAKDYTQGDKLVRLSPSTGAGNPHVWGIYEPDTGSIQYICVDPATRKAALIDVVLNYDPGASLTSEEALDQVHDHRRGRRAGGRMGSRHTPPCRPRHGLSAPEGAHRRTQRDRGYGARDRRYLAQHLQHA